MEGFPLFVGGEARGEAERRPLPLSGVRVLDFSWVIAGPTTTRYLAAMGAEVIKVEAPGKGDPGRSSGLHTVLGQGKQGIVLDLKKPEAVAALRAALSETAALASGSGLAADEQRETFHGFPP